MATRKFLTLTLAAALGLAACADRAESPLAPGRTLSAVEPQFAKAGSTSGNYILIGAGEVLPANLATQVAAAGGTLKQSFPEIGVAVATAANAQFADKAAKIKGLESVTPDRVIQWVPEMKVVPLAVTEATKKKKEKPKPEPEPEPVIDYKAFQWGPGAIGAPEAWAAGYTGKGVRVAVIDGGIWDRHQDIAPNLDRDASVSMVEGVAYNEDTGPSWHGTHVAGIIAAAGKGMGTNGIAPEATLISVKALHGGEGDFASIFSAILYAATPRSSGGAGADIINMSLGMVFDGKGQDLKGPDKRDYKKDVKELMKAIDRAVWYANRMRVTVFAAVGNEALNLDSNKELMVTPAGNRGVISIAATGPVGWAKGATNFDRPASYTNLGKSLVSFSAPGGDYAYPGNDDCTVEQVTRPCTLFDMVLAPDRGKDNSTDGYAWMAGTSQAAPVAAGVAALIIQKNGGSMHPAQVEAKLLQSASGNGNTAFSGHGWVNARRAVGLN